MSSPNYYSGVRNAVPVPYVAGPVSATVEALHAELIRLQGTVEVLTVLVPQVANEPPRSPVNGMIRYAQAPWNPLGTGNRWVQYLGGSWVAFP
jgi:hypothetical protein